MLGPCGTPPEGSSPTHLPSLTSVPAPFLLLQAASDPPPPLTYPQPPGIMGKAITSGLSFSLILIKDSGHRVFA